MRAFLSIAFILLFSSQLAAQAIKHEVGFSRPSSHYYEVTTRFQASENNPQVMMAAWTPGSYLIREYARNIDQLEAFDAQDRPLTVDKVAKNRWVVRAGKDRQIVLKYQVYAREMSVRTSWLEDGFGFINAASVFLLPETGLKEMHQVEFDLPRGWSVDTALPKTGSYYRADNFDHLVDSPFILGSLKTNRFNIEGRPHYLVSVGDLGYWELDQAADDLAKLVQQQYDLWQFFPYPNAYRFQNVVAEAGGGLEHNESTMIMASRWQMRQREDYIRWLELASHEFFHAWNVRQLRPKGLQQYDYENENYTDGLWLSEGFTSYYGALLLARAGLMEPKEYFKSLSRRIHGLENTPGRNVRSAERSSFDAWIKLYRPDENSINSNISYYTKGAIIALVMDMEIRERSRNRYNLDDLMRQLYRRHVESGFSSDHVAEIAAELTGSDWGPWFERYVSGTEELPVDDALAWAGLTLQRTKDDPESGKDPNPSSLGLTLDTKDNRLVIQTVPTESAAAKAGLNVGDEIIAINQIRALPDSWDKLWKRIRVGETVDVLVARRGRLITLAAEPQDEVLKEWKIKEPEEMTSEQRTRLKSWLGEQWFEPEEEAETAP